jgi:hypothetical protein
MSPLRSLLCLCVGVAACGCTPVQWQHTALGVSPSEAELEQCNQAAFQEAQRQAFFNDFAWPRRFGRHWHRPWPYSSTSDRFFLERDLFDFCMRAKGYRLVPAPAA